MNQQNETIRSIRQSIEIINKVLPSITDENVKQSLTQQKESLEAELEKLLPRI